MLLPTFVQNILQRRQKVQKIVWGCEGALLNVVLFSMSTKLGGSRGGIAPLSTASDAPDLSDKFDIQTPVISLPLPSK